MTIPDTMRAVVVRAHGGPEALEFTRVPVPRPGPNEVLLKVEATGLNHLDIWVRRGVETHRFPLPLIPGCDVAGTIAAFGSAVTGWNIGDRVTMCPVLCCLTCIHCLSGAHNLCRFFGVLGETTDGACAEFVKVPAANLLRIPGAMSFVHAAALPLVSLTAHHMLFESARLKAGETVLVHAAGSGVGSMAIQLARLAGARVIATASSDVKLEAAKALGADEVINYSTEDWGSRVRELTGKAGVEVVFESIGQATWQGSLKSLAKGGRLVTCGATSGPLVETDLRLVFFKSLSIIGSTMGSLGEMRQIWRLVEQGRLHPVLDRTFPMAELREAHTYIEQRQQFGKVVILPEWHE